MGAVGALFAASTAANAMSSASTAYSQGTAIKMQGNYQKNQLQFNSQVADLQAEDAINRGTKAAESTRRKTRQMIGSQRVALAAQGIDVNDDTALLIQQDTAGLGQEDVDTIKNNAWREAWGYRVQALDYMTQAKFADISSKFQAGQTFLTGGLNAARDLTSGAYGYAKNGKQLQSYWNSR